MNSSSNLARCENTLTGRPFVTSFLLPFLPSASALRLSFVSFRLFSRSAARCFLLSSKSSSLSPGSPPPCPPRRRAAMRKCNLSRRAAILSGLAMGTIESSGAVTTVSLRSTSSTCITSSSASESDPSTAAFRFPLTFELFFSSSRAASL